MLKQTEKYVWCYYNILWTSLEETKKFVYLTMESWFLAENMIDYMIHVESIRNYMMPSSKDKQI